MSSVYKPKKGPHNDHKYTFDWFTTFPTNLVFLNAKAQDWN
jgi:hypothetical protein